MAEGEVVGRELLLGVWGIYLNDNVEQYAYSYLTHCNELRSIFQEDGLSRANRTEIVQLVQLVKGCQDRTVKEIEDGIIKAKFSWLTPPAGVESIRNTLEFAIRLWLFIEPDLSDQTLNLSLAEVVGRSVRQRIQPGGEQEKTAKSTPVSKAKVSIFGFGSNGPLVEDKRSSIYLPDDFSEKSLTRKGGIKLEWSSYLSDHLSLTGKTRLRVFRHVSAIQSHSELSRSLLYPRGFLQETERTLALLFDPLGDNTSKRTRRIERRNHVDLEARIHSLINSEALLDIRTYPYWQERLRRICMVYEDAQPKNIRQWWFDRRNRFNWATFWAAFVVFCLTLVFGIISSITGIMQVYASFKGLRE